MVPEAKRIKFSKTGKLKYVSHLDLCRTMRIAFIRSGVPIWYSEGFNPHPKMVFALTVPTGTESLCEFLDIKITEDVPDEKIARMLNAVLTPELHIEEVYSPGTKFTEIGLSAYTIKFFDGTKKEELEKKMSGPLIITRHKKKGDVTGDIKPLVESWETSEEDGKTVLRCVLSARQNDDAYLNPEYLARAIGGEDYDITRTDVMFSDGRGSFR